MSDSVADSGHDTNSTLETTHTDTSAASTSVTLGKIPPNKSLQYGHADFLPQLPSHKFRFSVWHDLREACLTGDQLHAPRVRRGPEEKEKEFYKIEQEGLPIHHDLRGSKRHNHMNQLENWEAVQCVNLSYQELCHDYQKKNFSRILNRCTSGVTVNLVHNELVSLRSVTLPSCQFFNIDVNYLKSFKDFPELPAVQCITAVNNAVNSLGCLTRYASTLKELNLKGNPVSFEMDYRTRVMGMLPNLVLLDGIPRQTDEPFIAVRDEASVIQRACPIL